MSEEANARKLNSAIDAVIKKFPSPVFNAIRLRDSSCPFHIEVFRNDEDLRGKGLEVFKIRVTIGRIEETDKKACREYKIPYELFTKMIVCKKPGRNNFEFFTISKIKQ